MRRRATVRSPGSRPVPITWIDPVAGSPIDLAVGGLLLIVLALLGLVWGAAFFSSWFVNGEPTELTVGDAGLALIDLGRNNLAWDGAWSPEVQESLPGPRWFWLAFAIESVVLALVFWPLWRVFGPRPSDPMAVVIEENTPKHPRQARLEAQQAVREQRRTRTAAVIEVDEPAPVVAPNASKIVIDAPPNGRLVLGRVGERLVVTEKCHSVLALGPTGSGKTSSLALPAVLEWRGPVLVVSAKADLVSLVWDERVKRGGRSWLFDPTGSAGRIKAVGTRATTGHGWSPLQLIDDVPRPRNEPDLTRRVRQWALARRSARWMVNGVRGTASTADVPTPWYGAAEQMLAPMLLAAAAEEVTIGQMLEWVDHRDEASVRAALQRAGVAEAEAAWAGAHRYDATTTVGCYQLLSSILYPFGDPVVRAKAGEGRISTRDLLDGNANTLFVLAPANHQQRLRPLLTTMISEVVDTAMNQATASATGRLEEPLLVVVDDAADAAPIELLDQVASIGAGLGIQLLTLAQDLSQLGRISGQVGATQLADSHRARVLLPGITDPVTLNYLNALIRGNRLSDTDLPLSADDDGDAVVSRTATWLRTLQDGAAVLIYGNLAPIRMRLRPWYGDRSLVDRLDPAQPVQKKSWFDRFRRPSDDLSGGGFPNPFDSEANNREADRYWEAVRAGGVLPEPLRFDDGAEHSENQSPIR